MIFCRSFVKLHLAEVKQSFGEAGSRFVSLLIATVWPQNYTLICQSFVVGIDDGIEHYFSHQVSML